MKSRIMLVLGGMGVLLLPPPSHSQSIDKKSFCKDIHMIVTAFSQHTDSLKGKFIGENSLGIRQWDARYCLPGAIAKFYEHTLLESNEEYRATYIMTQDVQQKEAEELYKHIVSAVRWCYGADYFLNEQETTEWDNNGRKHQHHEATFTYTGIEDKGIKMPVMLVRAYSIESGWYSVTVELYRIE